VSNLSFDQYQFADRAQQAVHADYVGAGEFESTNIAYEDYTRMHTERHVLAPGRREDAPDWVFNDLKLRDVVVRCVECRAYAARIKTYKPQGTHVQRLARAQQTLASLRPELVKRIDRLCATYNSVAGDPVARKYYGQKVEEVDTQLRFIDNPALLLVGVAYHYWRSGLTSAEIGQQLGVKPPHVRKLLLQMKTAAGHLGYGPRMVVQHRPKATAEDIDRAIAAAKLTLTRTQKPSLHDKARQALRRLRRLRPRKWSMTPEQKGKISRALKGKPFTRKHKAAISAACKGKVVTLAARINMSLAKRTKEQTERNRALGAKHRRGIVSNGLIPQEQRLLTVVRMFKAGHSRADIAVALGWVRGNGTNMVKRYLQQAGLI